MIRLIREWFTFADSFSPWGPTGVFGATLNVVIAAVLICISLPDSPTPWGFSVLGWIAFVAVATRAWVLFARHRNDELEGPTEGEREADT